MAAPRRYPDEIRERAVRMAVGLRDTLGSWVTPVEIGAGGRVGTTSDEARRLLELEREVRPTSGERDPADRLSVSPRRGSTD